MLTWEDDLEVHALRKRGWSISAIARHTGHDRKTVRKYLAGDAEPGVRARPSPDPFDPFVEYVTARLVEDPHLWARTLFDELEGLGFGLSYQSLTRNIRARDLRPTCEACRTATDRPNAVIEHPPYGAVANCRGHKALRRSDAPLRGFRGRPPRRCTHLRVERHRQGPGACVVDQRRNRRS
jgi:hypothetical protein